MSTTNVMATYIDFNKAVEDGNIEIIDSLINIGAKPTENDLFTAIKCGYVNIVEFLLQCGIEPTEEMVCFSAHHDDLYMFEQLYKNIPRTNKIMIAAIDSNNISIIRCVIYDTEIPEEVLNAASSRGNLNIVELIIRHGASPSEKTLNIAVKNEHLEIVEYIFNLDVKPTEETLNIASKQDNFKLVKFIIGAGITPTIEMVYNAVKKENYKIAKYLADQI